MFQQTEACGVPPSTNVTCNPEILILATAARGDFVEKHKSTLPTDVLKTLHPLEYFCVRMLFANRRDNVSAMRALICLYASSALHALFRYLGFPVRS